MDAVTESVAEWLRSKGYVVIPKERHVVLSASSSIPRFEIESSRGSFDAAIKRSKDLMTRSIAKKLMDDNLIISKTHEADDPITGREFFVSVAAAIIKPKTA